VSIPSDWFSFRPRHGGRCDEWRVGARRRKTARDRSSCRWRHWGAAEFAPRSLALEMVRVAGSAAKACLRRVSRHGAVRPQPVGLNHFVGFVTFSGESLAC